MTATSGFAMLTISTHDSAVDSTPKLRRIKLLHTVVWAVMASSIVALPWLGWLGMFRWAFGLTLLITAECLILALNRGRCPLTDLAGRYTDDRADNFDVYLPLWLARHNKQIFGFLFVIGEVIVVWQWTRRP
jgi:hypothetical protein